MMRATARYLAPGIWLVVLLAMMGLLGHLLRKPNRVVVRNSGATPLSSWRSLPALPGHHGTSTAPSRKPVSGFGPRKRDEQEAPLRL
jgi:hypothetical protein